MSHKDIVISGRGCDHMVIDRWDKESGGGAHISIKGPRGALRGGVSLSERDLARLLAFLTDGDSAEYRPINSDEYLRGKYVK